MPRRPIQPRYFASRGAYFVQIGCRQHRLAIGPKDSKAVKDEAWKNFHALMAANAVQVEGDRNTCVALLNHYLKWVRTNQSGNTLIQRRRFLQSFVSRHGKIRVCDLKKHHVEDWLMEMGESRYDARRKKYVTWNKTSKRIAITSLVTALNWSKDQGLITVNPIAGMKRPPQVSRSIESLISDEQHQLLVERANRRKKKGFAHLLTALYDTGARPGEIANMTAKNYNAQLGAWVIDSKDGNVVSGSNKLAHHGKRRIIFLTERLKPLVESLNEAHPEGPIFRTQNGTAFGGTTIIRRINLMKDNIDRDRARQGLAKVFTPQITAYSYRHRFVTDWLLAGKPVAYLADLLGTSINMIQKHYSHLAEKVLALRQELMSFRRSDDGNPQV